MSRLAAALQTQNRALRANILREFETLDAVRGRCGAIELIPSGELDIFVLASAHAWLRRCSLAALVSRLTQERA